MVLGMPSDSEVQSIRRRPVCAVLATAVITGVPFKQAWDHYRSFKGNKWKGGLHSFETIGGIRHFGGEISPVSLYSDQNFSKFRRKAINKLAAYLWLVDPMGVYLVQTRCHMQVVQGNIIIDQSGRHPSNMYWARRKKVVSVWKVANPKINNDTQVIIEISKENMTMATNSKQNRAREIVPVKIAQGLSRKQILADLMDELQTTHGAASTFYHIVKKEMEAHTAPAATEETKEENVDA